MKPTKHLMEINSNCCTFCHKAYSATSKEITEKGKLFMVSAPLVGHEHFLSVVACPSCIRKQIAKTKTAMDEMLVEVEARETKKRCTRYYPAIKIRLTSCAACSRVFTSEDEDEGCCINCDSKLFGFKEDPRQVKIREKRNKKVKG